MPDIQSQVIRGHLQNVSVKYHEAEHIASEIFPVLEMPSDRAKVTVYNRGDQFRLEGKERERGTEATIRGYKTTTVDVDTTQYAVKHRITKEDLRDAGLPDGMSPPINMIQDALEMNAADLDRLAEKRVADAIFAATWLDGASGGTDMAGAWNDLTSSNPFLTNISTAKAAFVANGINPRTNLRLAMDYATFDRITKSAVITEQTKYTSDKSVTEEMLANILKIEKVVVGASIYSSANETKAGTDFTGAPIWSKNTTKGSAFLYHFPTSPGLKTMAAGYQPKRKVEGGGYRASYTHSIPLIHSWDYESQEEAGVKVIAAPAGYLWIDTLVT